MWVGGDRLRHWSVSSSLCPLLLELTQRQPRAVMNVKLTSHSWRLAMGTACVRSMAWEWRGIPAEHNKDTAYLAVCFAKDKRQFLGNQ